MKHIFIYLPLLALALASCSNIGENERAIYVEPKQAERAVLIEDFTGQRCPNCPNATEIIEQLIAQYGEENIIPVAFHCQPLGIVGTAQFAGLMNTESEAYGKALGVEVQPQGLVNRVGGLMKETDWTAAVVSEIQKKAPLNITVTASHNTATDSLYVKCDITALYDLNARLQLWLLQDSIVARQATLTSGYIDTYVHNHIFRRSINDFNGTPFQLANGKSQLFTHTVFVNNDDMHKTNPYNPDYVPEHLSVVAIVEDNSGVLQAVKTKVTITDK